MTTFDKRKDDAETHFKHKEELRFKATARRNKLFGLWVAEQMGLAGASADAYAKEMVSADFARPGDSDVIEKAMTDLKRAGVEVSEHHLRKEFDRLMKIARKQMESE